MKRQLVSVYDSGAQTFGAPFTVITTAQAVRSFKDEVNRDAPDNLLFQHPEDFILFHLAEFDDSDGSLDAFVSPTNVVSAISIKE